MVGTMRNLFLGIAGRLLLGQCETGIGAADVPNEQGCFTHRRTSQPPRRDASEANADICAKSWVAINAGGAIQDPPTPDTFGSAR